MSFLFQKFWRLKMKTICSQTGKKDLEKNKLQVAFTNELDLQVLDAEFFQSILDNIHALKKQP